MTAARIGKRGAKAAPAVTPWFPPSTHPVRVGVYETRTPGNAHSAGYQYWTGECWGIFNYTVDHAFSERDSVSAFQDEEWRGLAADPAKAGKP